MTRGTALSTGAVEEPDLLALIADDWTPLKKPAADRFREACRQVALEHDGDVDPSLVRERLLVGGELDIPPRQYSALWGKACGRNGYLRKTDVMVPITGSGSRGNTNKSNPLRRWVGDNHEQDRAS